MLSSPHKHRGFPGCLLRGSQPLLVDFSLGRSNLPRKAFDDHGLKMQEHGQFFAFQGNDRRSSDQEYRGPCFRPLIDASNACSRFKGL